MTKELKEAIMEVMEESEERGRADGIAYSLLTVLSAKGKVSEELDQRIQSEMRNEVLEYWLKIAVVTPDVGTFEDRIMW